MKTVQISSRFQGFTLIELLTVVAIVAILSTVAVPSFASLIASTRMTSSLNLLMTHVFYARSEAIKRQQKVVLCPTLDGQQCADEASWQHGILLFVDHNNNARLDENDELIRHEVPDLSDRLRIFTSAARKRVTFYADGSSPGSNLTMTFCDMNAHSEPKALMLSNTGRPRIADVGPDGRKLVCP